MRSQTPVSVVVDVPTALANANVQLQDGDGHGIAAQLTPLGLGNSSGPPASPTSAQPSRENSISFCRSSKPRDFEFEGNAFE